GTTRGFSDESNDSTAPRACTTTRALEQATDRDPSVPDPSRGLRRKSCRRQTERSTDQEAGVASVETDHGKSPVRSEEKPPAHRAHGPQQDNPLRAPHRGEAS